MTTKFCIPLLLTIAATDEAEAHRIGEWAALHLQETGNHDGSIVEAGALVEPFGGSTADENAAVWRAYLPIHKLCEAAGLTAEGGAIDSEALRLRIEGGAELERIRAEARAHDDIMDDRGGDGSKARPPQGDDYNDLFELVMNGAEDPWHLFYIEAADEDGTHGFIVSAQSASEQKARELAEASVETEGTDGDEPMTIEHCRCIGIVDGDIFERVGLLADA